MVALIRRIQRSCKSYKSSYPRTIRGAVIAAVVLHALLFIVAPPFDGAPHRVAMAEPPDTFIVVDDPDDENAENYEVLDEIDPPEEIDADIFEPDRKVEPTDVPVPDPPGTIPPRRGSGGENRLPFLHFDQNPELIDVVEPVYPRLSREAGIEGTVLLEVVVNEKGRVVSARTLHSDVTPAMEQAAIAAVYGWRFRPAKQRNRPVPARVAIPIEFRLR